MYKRFLDQGIDLKKINPKKLTIIASNYDLGVDINSLLFCNQGTVTQYQEVDVDESIIVTKQNSNYYIVVNTKGGKSQLLRYAKYTTLVNELKADALLLNKRVDKVLFAEALGRVNKARPFKQWDAVKGWVVATQPEYIPKNRKTTFEETTLGWKIEFYGLVGHGHIIAAFKITTVEGVRIFKIVDHNYSYNIEMENVT